MLACWTKEGSVNMEKVGGSATVGSETVVKLGRTCHPVKIAALGILL